MKSDAVSSETLMPSTEIFGRILRRMRPAKSQHAWSIGSIQRVGIAFVLAAVAISAVNVALVSAWLSVALLNEYVIRPIAFRHLIEPLTSTSPSRARLLGLCMGLSATCLWASLPTAIWLSNHPYGMSIALLAFAALLLHVVILFPRDKLVIISPYVICMLTLPFITISSNWNAFLIASVVVLFLTSVMTGMADRDRLVATLRDKDLQRRIAETASLQKSQFMATMSHELRTPLNAIIGYSELLVEESDAASKPDLGRILQAARHLLRLVDQVLAFSSIDSDQIRINVERIDALALSNAVLLSMSETARRHATEIVFTASHGDAVALGDRQRVEHCLTELLDNACRFGSEHAVRLRVTTTSSQVLFEVIDEGIGLSTEQIGLIFQPFVQVDANVTRKHDGLGLGLVLARKLARRMDGDIFVTSQLGQGSVFTLCLPRA